MRKFVVAFVYDWGKCTYADLTLVYLKTKRQTNKQAKKQAEKEAEKALKQADKEAFGVDLARQLNTRILFCEALSPRMEAMIIQNYYDAVIERTDLYFNENYPIGGYYESKLYLADERLFAISNFARKVIPNGNFNN